MKQKILIVDDEKPTRDAMARALESAYACLTAPDADLAMKLVGENPDIAVLLTDYKMPGDNGITLIKKAKAAIPNLGAILITAFGEIELAVEAMKQGADDFLTKPITDLNQLEFHVAQAVKVPRADGLVPSANQAQGTNHKAQSTFQDFTGGSPAMQKLYALIAKVAPSEATVLIGGPSGSGKELAARAIHKLSRRADKPFVAVECSAFSGDLLKSELFGYEPGTFTGGLKDGKAGCFEEAAGGTLFLDEIGELDMPTQIALLRTLESKSVRRIGGAFEKPVDFRLVAATNRDLPSMVVAGTFREDLFYRLNIINILMPPLREHRDDIAPLVRRFIKETAKRNASTVTGITPDALKALERYDWPGNVRQLRNVIERMVVLASGSQITQADLPNEIATPSTPTSNQPPATGNQPRVFQCSAANSQQPMWARTGNQPPATTPQQPATGNQQPETSNWQPATGNQPPATNHLSTLAATEKDQILAAIDACRGNKSKAAEMLGISRRTIHRKLNEWNLA